MPLALILPRGDQWYLLRKPPINDTYVCMYVCTTWCTAPLQVVPNSFIHNKTTALYAAELTPTYVVIVTFSLQSGISQGFYTLNYRRSSFMISIAASYPSLALRLLRHLLGRWTSAAFLPYRTRNPPPCPSPSRKAPVGVSWRGTSDVSSPCRRVCAHNAWPCIPRPGHDRKYSTKPSDRKAQYL